MEDKHFNTTWSGSNRFLSLHHAVLWNAWPALFLAISQGMLKYFLLLMHLSEHKLCMCSNVYLNWIHFFSSCDDWMPITSFFSLHLFYCDTLKLALLQKKDHKVKQIGSLWTASLIHLGLSRTKEQISCKQENTSIRAPQILSFTNYTPKYLLSLTITLCLPLLPYSS